MGVDDSSLSSSSSSSSSSAESSFRELDDIFLQSQARIWLEEVLRTRFDEQLNICDLLSDGELLFEVSKALWNMLLVKYMELNNIKAHMFIPVDTRKSSGRYRPYSNVDSFLKVCKVLGLSGVDLFSPSDVVEKKDARKVCICIRSLSKKARAKRLNVPDFDIVTKTVTMPKDVVRCIKRSLELSTSSPSKDTRLKFRSFAAHRQKDKSCLEESNNEKNNCSEMQSHSSYNDTSYTDALFIDSGDSPETRNNYALTEGIVQSQQINKFECEPGSAESICLQYVRNGSQLNSISLPFYGSQSMKCDEFTPVSHGAKFWHDNGELDQIDVDHVVGENALCRHNFVGDNRAEVNPRFHQISLSDMISFRILTNGPFHTSEDCSCHLCIRTESHDSNTSPNISMSRVWRKFPYDVETSPTSSMSSVGGRLLDFDFDAQSDPEDLRTSISLTLTKSLDKVSVMVDESQDMDNYVKLSDIAVIGPEESLTQFETNLGNFDVFADSCSPCWADQKSELHPQLDCSSKGVDETRKGPDGIYNDCLAVESSERCQHLIDVGGKGLYNVDEEGNQLCINQNDGVHCFAEDRNKAAIKDERKDDGIDRLAEPNTDDINDKGTVNTQKKPAHIATLLKTVAKGTALIGILLLLHLRKRSNIDIKGEASEKSRSGQIHVKSSGVRFSTRKGEKGRKIYPVEKFKFGDYMV